MIRKILRLQGVGLLQDACAKGAVSLAQVAAIYSDNGRGKSTLSAVLRACRLQDAGRVNARRTLDSATKPEVDLLLSTGSHVEFKAGAWTGKPPTIAVFDSEFVEENVYSGFEIRPDQRQALLEFALGDATVALKKQVEQLSQSIKGQTEKRSAAEKTLAALAPPYTLQDFVALAPLPDAQAQIDDLHKRVSAAKSAVQLGARQSPAALALLKFDCHSAFQVLGRTLTDVEQCAEEQVRAHLAKHGQPGIEAWVSNGQVFLGGDCCPFCGQAIGGLGLIKAYQSYFSAAYEALKAEIEALEGEATALGDDKIDAVEAALATNVARIDAWVDQLKLKAPSLDTAAIRTALSEARAAFLGLVAAKRQQPLAPRGTPQQQAALETALAGVNAPIAAYNQGIQTVSAEIAKFKALLASESAATLEATIKKLEAAQRRQLPGTVAAASSFAAAGAERKQLESEKANVRAKIDQLMQSTLSQYQEAINKLLGSFGAEFTIEQLKPTYLGGTGTPRTEYALRVRDKSVKLGSRADLTGDHAFANTLSESDKRTLAFAFFVARLRADPSLADTVVVLDDPVSSLDRNRREQSLRVIVELAAECHQLIMLSHDAYFVRAFRDLLADLKPAPVPVMLLALKRAQNGYSEFIDCDIDDMCSSDYYRHHRLVADYVDGKSAANLRDVAKAIRPLLEGYYHRRFPGAIPRKLTLGQIVALVLDPATTEPLSNLRPIVQEVQEVNAYAGKFHHDTNPCEDIAQVVDAELLPFARRALALIYKNG